MQAVKLFLITCSFAFLSACSSTPEAKSAIEPVEVEKDVSPEAVEYFGVEVLSSCLKFVVIKNDEFIGYKPRYFDFDGIIANPKEDKQMSCIAGLLNDYLDQVIEVRGYTDSKGTKAYNLLLSEKRSASIVDELLALGVAEKQLLNVALGETEPVSENLTEEDRDLNRRVEFHFVN